MTNRTTNCNFCSFCNFSERDGVKWQTSCKVQQLDKYKALKDRIDPNSNELDNAVLKYTEQDGVKAFVINAPCTFQRTQKWVEEHCKDLTGNELREFVFQSINFDYTLVVISDGNVKQTIRTVKSVCNGTLTPAMTEIVYPYKFINDKSKEDLFIALEDRLAKGDIKEQHQWWKFNIRQVVSSEIDNTRAMVLDAIQSHGRFWVLVLQAGEKIHEGFVESIKRQVVSELVDVHYLGLGPESALLAHPVLAGDFSLSKGATFKYKNSNLVQEWDTNWLSSFFNFVD